MRIGPEVLSHGLSGGREEGIEELLDVMRRPDTRVLHCDEDAGAGLGLPGIAPDQPENLPEEAVGQLLFGQSDVNADAEGRAGFQILAETFSQCTRRSG